MTVEFTMTKELVNVTCSASELASIVQLIKREIQKKEFHHHFDMVLDGIYRSYRLVGELLEPLVRIGDMEEFKKDFNRQYEIYKLQQVKQSGEPRRVLEASYDHYYGFRKLREAKTSFPLLKRSFQRLDSFLDRWVTNDVWLAMYIDNFFKSLNRWLAEVFQYFEKDVELAFDIYNDGINQLKPYLKILKDQIQPY